MPTHGIVHAGFSGLRAFVARKKGQCKLIGFRFVIPHDTIPSTLPGCKNRIKQLIAPEMDLPINIIDNDRSSITINFEGTKYCLTCNSDSYPNDIEYVLLTNIRPTSDRLLAKTITVKGWLKHPLQKEYAVDEVISSWKDDFFFKEENIEAEINGLRSPQLGALHMILGHMQLPLDTATLLSH